MKKLYKSRTDRRINGVCGGIAEYLEVDSTIVRVIFSVGILFGLAGLWAYLICMLIIPEEQLI